MMASQAIAALDGLSPNSYDFDTKLEWLRRVEAIVLEVLGLPAGWVDPETDLKAQPPYDEVYIRYLQAQIFLEAGEITRYNNAMALYNNALAGLRRNFIRGHVSDQPRLTGF